VIFLQRTFTSLVHAHAGRTQTTVGAHCVRWDTNTWAPFASLVILAHVFVPQSWALGL